MIDAKSACVCGAIPGSPNRDCERCQLVAEIERLRDIVSAICDNAEYQGELSQVCTDEYTPTPIHVWSIPLSGVSMSLREAAEKARET